MGIHLQHLIQIALSLWTKQHVIDIFDHRWADVERTLLHLILIFLKYSNNPFSKLVRYWILDTQVIHGLQQPQLTLS